MSFDGSTLTDEFINDKLVGFKKILSTVDCHFQLKLPSRIRGCIETAEYRMINDTPPSVGTALRAEGDSHEVKGTQNDEVVERCGKIVVRFGGCFAQNDFYLD